MEEEKDQLMKRVERLKKRVSQELACRLQCVLRTGRAFGMQIKIKPGMDTQWRMDSSNTGGKGISQAVAQNSQGPGVESLAVISGEYCLPEGNDKWTLESHDLLMPFSNVTVTCSTYSLTVGGDCSESSADA